MKKGFLFFITLCVVSFALSAEDLIVHPEDVRLVYDDGQKFENASGYHLYIRKKDGMESVMLVETTKDPSGVNDNYAYRALTYNEINGDEIRYLNGKRLVSEYSKFSLIDSTAEDDEVFGKAFHIYIPSEIQYGYPWGRNGTVKIDRGTFINIRSFAKKYADYTGAFADNPFMFDLGKPVEKPKPPVVEVAEVILEQPVEAEPEPEPVEEPVILTDEYNPAAAESFKDIAGFSGGQMVFSKGPESISDDLMGAIDRISPKHYVDVVFAIDATGSMKDDIQKLREEWVPQLLDKLKEFEDIRIGLLLYRDYGDNFNYKKLPVKFYDFTRDVNQFKRDLNSFKIYGTEGGDIPEAVYEALWGAMEFYEWRPHVYRKIILIGDAEPHPTPRGSKKYSKDLVALTSREKNVIIDTIIVPDDKSKRGR